MSPKNALQRTAGLGPQTWLDLIRALVELAAARMRLTVQGTENLLAGTGDGLPADLTSAQSQIVNRVAFAIPRAAARVPWSATCLVQALAAQHWLRRAGITSLLELGARKAGKSGLDAHAWLKVGDRIVVGGDVSPYRPFTMPEKPR